MDTVGDQQLVKILAQASGQDIDTLSEMLASVQGSEKELFNTLMADGLLSEVDCYKSWAASLELPFHSLDERSLSSNMLNRLPLDVVKRYGAVVVDSQDSVMSVALRNPFDILAVDTIQDISQCSIQVVVAPPAAIEKAVQRLERGQTGIEGLINRLQKESLGHEVLGDPEKLKQIAGNDAVIQLVDYVIDEALRAGASDIHLEPQSDSFRIRLRVDGDLEVMNRLPKPLHRPVCSRIKVLAKMDIGESRKPQDGRFVLDNDKGNDESVELRVSCMPSVFGEKVVMRVLDRSVIRLDLDHIGMSPSCLEFFRIGFHCSNGLVLVTGPTGSGKTTSLYAALSELNVDSRNLITVEDPVEYNLDGTTQVQVNAKAGRTFAQALRSILRQDPDTVMVGEIRDAETAGIAVQAALTGHMVLSTLHTNDAPGALFRMLDMGIEPYLLGPALRCVVAQRLVPKVCPDCAEPGVPEEGVLAACGLDPQGDHSGFVQAKGCKNCRGKGRRGRVTIHEVLSVDVALSRLISGSAPEGEILKAARSAGYRPMLLDGVSKAKQGLVFLEDVLAVARAT